MSLPKISFVVPTKNRDEWLGECLMGLLAQTVPVEDVEIVIVDDGSTDGTHYLLEWASKFERVKIIRNETSIGAGASRNKGMELATAPIIAVCDDDDVYPEERAQLILDWFKANPDSEMVNFPNLQVGYFNEEMERFMGEPFDHERMKEKGEINYFSNPTVAFKKAAMQEVGGYPSESEKTTDDYEMVKKWVGMGKKIDFDNRYFHCFHRVLPGSMMSNIRGWDAKWSTKYL